ncbi:MAG: M48 family metallopeptidase [Desulfovibrionaceae bacterium]
MAGLMLLLAGCAKAPYTGRNQVMLVSQAQELQLGRQSADEILQKEPKGKDPQQVALVEHVGERVAAVADRPDFGWEFHLIEAPDTANAFCLPGGKVFVYTGLFKYATTEGELAAVVAHEVGHAIARHGAERMSISLITQLGHSAASIALSGTAPVAVQAFEVAYGIGANVGVILPFSREQEYEADHLGLILMAKAGFDPKAALSFWERMSQADTKKPPEFLSTHPSDANRIASIRSLMPEAQYYYTSRR